MELTNIWWILLDEPERRYEMSKSLFSGLKVPSDELVSVNGMMNSFVDAMTAVRLMLQ